MHTSGGSLAHNKLTDNVHGAQCRGEGAEDSDRRGIAMREEVHTAQCGRAADRVRDSHERAVEGVRNSEHDLHADDVGQRERREHGAECRIGGDASDREAASA